MRALVILGATVLAALIGYVAMFAVKPAVSRPAIGEHARAEIDALGERLMRHVRVLGGRVGERNLFRPDALQAAAEHIRQTWSEQGFSVTSEAYEVAGQHCANLFVEHRGSSRAHELVVVGAHYDSVVGSPGANDNATGVAILLEMSSLLRASSSPRSLRLVAFVNEEPPFFATEHMGSRRHARNARARGDQIVAMISLETLGYYSDDPSSQRYPFPLGAFYPSTGNFLGVVGNLGSRSLVRDMLRYLMEATDLPVEGAATFAWLPGVDWSDHRSFWKEGYRAVMLTDTALYRYPQYHSAEDRPEKINAGEFARAAHGIIKAVQRLASAPPE